MSGCSRLVIASVDADALERIFACAPDFFVVGSDGGAEAFALCQALCPDVLVADGVLAGADGAHLLRLLSRAMPAPPRTVFLRRMDAGEAAADAVCPYPCGGEALLAAARKAAEQALPALAAPWEEARGEIAAALLARLGTPQNLKGCRYLSEAAACCACAPGLREGVKLYPYLAEKFGTTPAAAEKAIRAAIEQTWLRGDLEEIQRLFGWSVDAEKGKPTNNECVAMLSEHTRRALIHRMAAENDQ